MGLELCCPISISIRGVSTEVPIDNLDEPPIVAASLIQTLSWSNCKATFIVETDPSNGRGIISNYSLRGLMAYHTYSNAFASDPTERGNHVCSGIEPRQF